MAVALLLNTKEVFQLGKNSLSRTEAESKEKLETVSNDIPENRYQDKQQVQNSDEALNTKAVNSGYSLKKQKSKGSSLKQEAIAEVISGGSDSGMGINAGGRSVSGTAGGILTADNSTPVADKVRSKTRFGKKTDRLATKLNYTPCEQTIVNFDESKPLADAANEDQGYNGTYRNEYARSQKASGAVPGDLMFQRSVDYILKDQMYFSEGQVVLPANTEAAKLAYTPDKTYAGNKTMADYKIHVGDFVIKEMHNMIDANGEVRYCYFDVEDVTAYETDHDLANKSSAFRLILSNRAELDRIAMDAKAGDEKADIWTPLARAVYQPSKSVYLLRMIESQTGTYPVLAYAKAGVNFSHQLNRALKDGQDIAGPAVEEAIGLLREYSNSKGYTNYRSGLNACFNQTEYRAGAASTIVPLYDSPSKYNNKADWLLQPRGPRMHLQTADNNINSLHVDKTFVDTYFGNECYSTIDREYDPLLPVCITDKAGVIDPININELSAFVTKSYTINYSASNIETDGGETASQDKVYTLVPAGFPRGTMYVYQKVTNGGAATITGLKKLSSGKIGFAKEGDNAEDCVIELLLSHSNTIPTGYSLVGSWAAGSAIELQMLKTHDGGVGHDRITAMSFDIHYGDRLYMKDAGPYTYSYSDLRNNYVVEVKHPLTEGIIELFQESIGSKIYSLIGDEHEFVLPWTFSTQYASLAAYIICAATPWIQQVRLNSMKDVLYYEDNVHEYPFSNLVSVKEVPFHNYVNFDFKGYDEPIETKIMQPTQAIRWVMPEFFWHVDGTYEDYVAPWYFNQAEFDLDNYTIDPQNAAMSMPSIRSGIRLGVVDTFYGMSEKDIRLALDRMTTSILGNAKVLFTGAYKYGLTTDGQIFIRFGAGNDPFTIREVLSAPHELGLLCEVPGYVLTPNGTSGVASFDTNGMGTSYRIKVWTAKNASNPDASILATDAIDITRGANYTQRWYQIDANLGNSNEQIYGLVFGLNDEGAAEFTPFIGLDNSTAVSNAPTVVSHQRSLWTRLQTLPFAISPFDAEPTTGSANMDIYDLMYIFGLAGFRASDYRESVYNRSKEVVNQGLLFINDPWVESSPIITHGASATGVKMSKGYELK